VRFGEDGKTPVPLRHGPVIGLLVLRIFRKQRLRRLFFVVLRRMPLGGILDAGGFWIPDVEP
jgi:hypothetical protein